MTIQKRYGKYVYILAVVGYMNMLGIDIEAANSKHLAKIFERGNRPRERGRC